jgi:uncharacterized membrane protein
MNAAELHFDEQSKQRIVSAIQAAELRTSGEVKVMIENRIPNGLDVWERAKELFLELKLFETRDRNGVFIYLAFEDHRFAILGDTGINQVVPTGFWDETRDLMKSYFIQNQFIEGIEAGVHHVGERLREYFPYLLDDINELSDDVIVR